MKGLQSSGRYTDQKLYEIIVRLRSEGFQVAAHAIGDACVHQILDVYEKVLNESPLNDHRYRIEHYAVVNNEDMQRTAKHAVIPSQFRGCFLHLIVCQFSP